MSFTEVRLCLVVGVCGAVPVNSQTRDPMVLGDVVISNGIVDTTLDASTAALSAGTLSETTYHG